MQLLFDFDELVLALVLVRLARLAVNVFTADLAIDVHRRRLVLVGRVKVGPQRSRNVRTLMLLLTR